MSNFKREKRYVVLKVKDVDKYLTSTEEEVLDALTRKVATARFRDKKPALAAVVVEADWPEYDGVWRSIEARSTL